MKLVKILLLISFSYAQLSRNINDPNFGKEASFTKKSIYKQYLSQALPGYLFFGPYSFMYGVSLGGSAISRGESPFKANTFWLATPLLAGALVHLASKDLINNTLAKPTHEDYSSTFYYNIYFVSPDISSIQNISFKALDSSWDAKIDEVPSGFDYPSLGFRTGFMTEQYGVDYEMSLIEHHTSEKNIIYEYNSPATGIVPLEQKIPSHFYMLHSMYMGINTYYVLPNFFITPYLGVGGGVLMNSVQSEYPGPADLAREDGSLALDEMGLSYGAHAFLGFRHVKENLFYYFEIRPAVHKFDLESGSIENKSKDKFDLELIQFQIGIGQNIFK